MNREILEIPILEFTARVENRIIQLLRFIYYLGIKQ